MSNLRLRPYKPCDAAAILSWIRDEGTFRRWSFNRYASYPITAADINHKYIDCNGDCKAADNFYPMTAFDENGAVGHFIMRFLDEEKAVLRLGFVIVDDAKRGRGYGKEMLRLALKFAFEILKVQKVTIGVFANNPAAYHCYKSVGFRDARDAEPAVYDVMGEQWTCLELEMEEAWS